MTVRSSSVSNRIVSESLPDIPSRNFVTLQARRRYKHSVMNKLHKYAFVNLNQWRILGVLCHGLPLGWAVKYLYAMFLPD
jgi:hypothetical protein